MTNTKHPDDQVKRPFAEFILDQGSTHGELTDALHDLIAAVLATEKAGTITLQIKVTPDKRTPDMLRVSDKVTLRKPEFDRRERVYWPDADGNLSRSNPAQPSFEGLQVIDSPADATKTRKENHA
ncbi:hypothetical protein [Micrococcus lylae]|uniref:hypothetical protein n=1 Tax=Micrococcus lylae TaxID=1273 RepID=UPI00082B6C2A|nr:hypothetical protein [Micrococcus lylae]